MELPYSDEDFLAFSQIIRDKESLFAIDPRTSASMVSYLVWGAMTSEQTWLTLKLNRYHRKQAKILYGIYDGRSLQAYAMEVPTHTTGYIAVSFRLLTEISVYFNCMLANPLRLANIGDTTNEIWPRVGETRGKLGLVPIDPKRKAACIVLMTMALRFLTAHEMIHILNGHLRLDLKDSETRSISEASINMPTGDALRSQTLEMDADSGAILECITDELIMSSISPSEISTVTDGSKEFNIGENNISLWLFAIYSIFRLLDQYRADRPIEQSSHPPPMLRLIMVIKTLDAIFERDGLHNLRNSLWGSCEEVLKETMKDSYEIYMQRDPSLPPRLSQANASVESNPELAEEKLNRYLQTLEEEWKRLHPLLQPLSRSNNKLAVPRL